MIFLEFFEIFLLYFCLFFLMNFFNFLKKFFKKYFFEIFSQEYGKDCDSSSSAYRMNIENSEPRCKNGINSCKRSICECDKHFAITVGQSKIFVLKNIFRNSFSDGRNLKCKKNMALKTENLTLKTGPNLEDLRILTLKF